MNLSTKQKQTHRYREQTCGCEEGGGGRDGSGVCGQQMQTIIYRMHKQQGPTVQHRNYIQYPIINHNGKEYVCVYIYITESLCHTPETNTTLKINYRDFPGGPVVKTALSMQGHRFDPWSGK